MRILLYKETIIQKAGNGKSNIMNKTVQTHKTKTKQKDHILLQVEI